MARGVPVEVTESIEVMKPASAVYALLDDPMRYPEWVESAKSVEAKGGGAFHVTLKERGPGMDGQVVARQPPASHHVRLRDERYFVELVFALEDQGGSTRVKYTRRLDTAKGGFGFMTGMVRKGTEKSVRKELAALKRILEG